MACKMEVFLAFLAFVAVASGYQPGLRVRFDAGLTIGTTFFFAIPMTEDAVVTEGWKKTRPPTGARVIPQLVMYCYEDKIFCAFYDDTGYIAGVQVALPKSEFTENQFDWRKRGFTSWNTAVDGQCKLFWTIQQYFVSEEFLATSKEDRIASRDSTRILQAGGVWLTGFDKELKKISNKTEDIVSGGLFTEQNFIIWMGQHYFYNMSSTMECTDDQMFPWFLLTSGDELIATGFITSGQLETASDQRDWFERPGQLAVEVIAPYAPQCIYDMADDPGLVTMHIYYIDDPWYILTS